MGNLCRWLRSGLTFGPKGLHHCCVTHHGDNGFVKICDYDGGPLPIGKIRQHKQEMMEKHFGTEEGNDTCTNCVFRYEVPQHDSEYLFDQINFSHYTHCNLKCTYCYIGQNYNDGGTQYKDRSYYDVLPALYQMIHNGLLRPDSDILWGGGETAMLRKLEETLSLLVNHGCKNFLYTNATILSEPILKYIDSPMIKLIVGIDAGTEETYVKIKRHRMIDKVFKNLAAYVKAGPKATIVAKYILTNENFHEEELDAFHDRVVDSGCEGVEMDIDLNLRSEQHHVDAINYLGEKFRASGLNVNHGGCGTNANPHYVDASSTGGTMHKLVQIEGT
jgi:sulfatase maturation enzyme AslB (radical SAM superfamily)